MESPFLDNLKLLLYVCKLLYPKLNSLYFPLYMFVRYNQIKAREFLYQLKQVPDELVAKILNALPCDKIVLNDPNNTIFINRKQFNTLCMENFAKICSKEMKSTHFVLVCVHDITPDTILVSDTLFHNLKQVGLSNKVNLIPCHQNRIKLASSVNVSLINTPYEISNATIDTILKHYFSTPKIVQKKDLISINLRRYGSDVYFTNIRVNKIDILHFKCNKIEFESKSDCNGSYFCIYNKTTLTQSANKQSYVVPNVLDVLGDDKLIDSCPQGLTVYLKQIERAIKPFLNNKCKLNLKPMFLLQGSKGSGKMAVVKYLTRKYGLNLFRISNCDISGSVYTLTETRLKNAIFRTKLSAPCVLVLKNFENFGKNNEGQYDPRIISCFKREIEDLFSNNIFPVILICLANTKDVSADLKRTFLEVFDINAPNQTERVELLSWLLDMFSLNCDVDLETIASKTHGFLYEDLEALIYYAKMNCVLENGQTEKMELHEQDFSKALDVMHSNYRESLGAPKVPQVQWSDVGGLDDVKNEIIKSINLPLQHPELLQKSGLHRSGILLYGPPGTGKTLMAKAVATECNLCFLSVKGPELLNSYVGQSEQNVREVFEKARQAAPCIIFFDELDSLAPNRGVTGDSGGVMDRIVSQLLAEIDGLNEAATIFVIGATNRPDLIDPALLRPGRFDKLLYVGPCTDAQSKLSVLSALTRKFKLSDDVDLKQVVEICPENITGADFYGVCSTSWMSAARKLIKKIENGTCKEDDITQEDVIVTMDDFTFAINNVKPSVNTEDLVYFNKLKSELSSNM